MRINNIQNNTFKSGLTKQILEKEAHIKPKQVENYFKNSPYSGRVPYFKNIDLKDNNAYALGVRMCAEIFKNFSRKHNLSGLSYAAPKIFPSDIIVFDKADLSDDLSNEEKKDYMNSFHAISCYIGKYNSPLKGLKKSIIPGSILIPNIVNRLKKLNELAEHNKKTNFHSTDHFLDLIVHEWLHCIEDNHLYSAIEAGGNYDSTVKHHGEKHLSKRECEIVADVLGEYSAECRKNQYNEVVAEAWTKFICESLDNDSVHFKKDPIEEMRKTSKEFQKILKKASTIDIYEHNYLTGEDKLRQFNNKICFHPSAK